jgi:N-acyl-D-amino-acid deacylase
MTCKYDIVIRNSTIVDGTGAEGFIGDVAISGDKIMRVGKVADRGSEEVDATGLLLTPGFVDIHTHYDGQAIWENRITPSSQHGVTTVVMGSCGVGFAPCRARDRDKLIDLMEGVEDIPESVMAEGLIWDWESFPDYLAAVESRQHDINIACLLPHSALRVFVMGDRALARENATEEDLAEMARITAEAVNAGALGVGTSRSIFHRSSSGGFTPTFGAAQRELETIAMAMKGVGRGVFQIASTLDTAESIEPEIALMRRLAEISGRPISFPLNQLSPYKDRWREVLDSIEEANADGLDIKAQALPRAIGIIVGLELSMHPFAGCPTFIKIRDLPLSEKVQRLRTSEVRARLLQEAPREYEEPIYTFVRQFGMLFKLDKVPDYEQPYEQSIEMIAKSAGVSPDELVYDLLLEDEGHAKLYQCGVNVFRFRKQ